MRTYKTVKQEYTEKIIDKCICDFCKKEIVKDETLDSYCDINFFMEEGISTSYNWGRRKTEIRYDICNGCFIRLTHTIKVVYNVEPSVTPGDDE
jgi:hypothetical protein